MKKTFASCRTRTPRLTTGRRSRSSRPLPAARDRLPPATRGIKTMPMRKVMLKYPEGLIQEPVLFRMAKQFDVMPNIRRARVTETIGEIVAELDGAPESLDGGIRYLEQSGVVVEPVEGDIVE